jgi:hypothetical protein
VGAVTEGVGVVVVDSVVGNGGAASKLVVGGQDTRVNNVSKGAGASAVVVDVAG